MKKILIAIVIVTSFASGALAVGKLNNFIRTQTGVPTEGVTSPSPTSLASPSPEPSAAPSILPLPSPSILKSPKESIEPSRNNIDEKDDEDD